MKKIEIEYNEETGNVSMVFDSTFKKDELMTVLHTAPIVAEAAYATGKMPKPKRQRKTTNKK